MKLGTERSLDLDAIDLQILRLMQENCRLPLAKIGDHVGLSAPSVMERIKKLEDSGVIMAYRAVLDARVLSQDVTAFIGVSIGHPRTIERFEKTVQTLDEVLECHHVTGSHTLLLKVKTWNTSALEALIRRIRSIEGVVRTETMVVLSTLIEHTRLALHDGGPGGKRERKAGHGDKAVHLKRA